MRAKCANLFSMPASLVPAFCATSVNTSVYYLPHSSIAFGQRKSHEHFWNMWDMRKYVRGGRRTWTMWRESEETILKKFCSMPPSRIDVAFDCKTSFKWNLYTLQTRSLNEIKLQYWASQISLIQMRMVSLDHILIGQKGCFSSQPLVLKARSRCVLKFPENQKPSSRAKIARTQACRCSGDYDDEDAGLASRVPT